MLDELDLSIPETIIFRLRSLYSRYGYTRFKMNKFEEYDLYANNKDFLISDGVLTFTDGNGKRLVTAEEARLLRRQGRQPAPGAVLTPLAKEILEGSL